MTTSIRVASAVSGCLLLAAVARAGEASPFDSVKDGVLTIYTIDDLTLGQTAIADQIGKLIRETNAVDGWTDTGGTTAAMRVTPERLTVKAPPAVHKDINGLLAMLRKGRALHIRMEYRVVDSATLRPRELGPADGIPAAKPPLSTPASDRVMAKAGLHKPEGQKVNWCQVVDPTALPADVKTVLDVSQVTVANGDEAVWVDGVGLPLPTIRSGATVTADRKLVLLTLKVIHDKVRPTTEIAFTFCVPFGRTGAVALDENRWLLFTPTLVLTETKPA